MCRARSTDPRPAPSLALGMPLGSRTHGYRRMVASLRIVHLYFSCLSCLSHDLTECILMFDFCPRKWSVPISRVAFVGIVRSSLQGLAG